MEKKLGEKIRDIIEAAPKPIYGIPDDTTREIIRKIEENESAIIKYCERHPYKKGVSNDDLNIEMPKADTKEIDYWRLHGKHVAEHFGFESIDISVKYIGAKYDYDDDGLVTFTIYP